MKIHKKFHPASIIYLATAMFKFMSIVITISFTSIIFAQPQIQQNPFPPIAGQTKDSNKSTNQNNHGKEISINFPPAVSGVVSSVVETKSADQKGGANAESEEWIKPINILTLLLVAGTFLLWWATRALVRGSQDASKRQLRAYVSVIGSGSIPNSIVSGLPAFQIKIKNSGQTPAYRLKSWRGIGIHETPLKHSITPMPGTTDGDAVLGAGGESILPIRRKTPFQPEEVAKVRAGTHAIYVFGGIEYIDAFDTHRHTNFCLYVADGGPDAGLKHSHIGNDAD